jgi:hypothetical protein
MMDSLNSVWSTADEIRFFKDAHPLGVSKLKFLQNYKEALCERTNWDDIDKKKLMKELNKSIKLLQGE